MSWSSFDIQFGHEVENPGAFAHGLEDQPGVAVGAGGFDGVRGYFQEVVKFKKIVLAQIVLETFFGLAHFFLEVFFMAPEGREAGAVILTEG